MTIYSAATLEGHATFDCLFLGLIQSESPFPHLPYKKQTRMTSSMSPPLNKQNFIINRIVLSNAQPTRTNFLSTTKNRSENRFMCAYFCSNIKSLRSFLGVAYDEKLVRVR